MVQMENQRIEIIHTLSSLLDIPTKVIDTNLNISSINEFSPETEYLWVRTIDNHFCGVVKENNDINLILSTAKRKSNEGEPVVIQQGIKGKTYHLIGYRMAYHFLPVEIIGVEFTAGNYRVPYLLWVPADCSGRESKVMIEKAKSVAKNLPIGYYGILMEFTVNSEGIFLSFLDTAFKPDKDFCEICKEGTGIDLEKVHQTIESQGIPDSVPSRELGCAVAWIIPHSGIVQSIKNVEEVKKIDGVKQVCIHVQEGDTLTHITDIDSRNKVGYVIAIGPDSFTARNRVLSAVSQVEIHTSNLLP